MTAVEINEIYAKKEAFIDGVLKSEVKEIAKLQRVLFDEISQRYISRLELEGGKIKQTAANYRILNELDTFFKQFADLQGKDFVKNIGEKMLQTIEFTDQYYRNVIGVSEAAFNSMQAATSYIYEKIGITPSGELIQGGYLQKLSQMPEVQTQITNYIRDNVVSGAGLAEFQKGFKTLVVGNKDITGAMQKYHQQFSFDTFNQVDEAVNKVYADSIGLKYFIYAGTIIKTSRCFCRKRAGKVFSIDDTKNWKNDDSLLSYYKQNPYNPLIDRGGFNCRHNIRYIPEAYAKRLGYDKAAAMAVVDASCPE